MSGTPGPHALGRGSSSRPEPGCSSNAAAALPAAAVAAAHIRLSASNLTSSAAKRSVRRGSAELPSPEPTRMLMPPLGPAARSGEGLTPGWSSA